MKQFLAVARSGAGLLVLMVSYLFLLNIMRRDSTLYERVWTVVHRPVLAIAGVCCACVVVGLLGALVTWLA